MLLEKLGGAALIAVAVVVLVLISILNPPTFVQIIVAFIGSVICLIGIVIIFAEDPIWIKERQVKAETAPKASRTSKVTAS